MVNDINMQGLNYKGESRKPFELSRISKNSGNNVKNQPPSYDEWLLRFGSEESSITTTEDIGSDGSLASNSPNDGYIKEQLMDKLPQRKVRFNETLDIIYFSLDHPVKNGIPSTCEESLLRFVSDESRITITEDKSLEESRACSIPNQRYLKGRVRANTISGLTDSDCFSDIINNFPDIKKQN